MANEAVMRMTMFRTDEVVRMTGISRLTLFRWEKRGVILPLRDRRGWRYFSAKDVETVKMIARDTSRTPAQYKMLLARLKRDNENLIKVREGEKSAGKDHGQIQAPVAPPPGPGTRETVVSPGMESDGNGGGDAGAKRPGGEVR